MVDRSHIADPVQPDKDADHDDRVVVEPAKQPVKNDEDTTSVKDDVISLLQVLKDPTDYRIWVPSTAKSSWISNCKPEAKTTGGEGISNPHVFLEIAFRNASLFLGLAQVFN